MKQFATLIGAVLVSSTIATPFPQNYVSAGQCPAGCGTIYSDVDDPDPHQVYRFDQMTGKINCGKAKSCSITDVDLKSKSIKVTGTIGDWVSAKLEVSKTWTTGQLSSCDGEAGESICVFYRTAHTIYSANSQSNECCRAGPKSRTTLTSPNKDGKGSESICGRGEQCKQEGYQYWNNMESHNGGKTWAEGPVDWPFGEDKTGLLPELK